MPERLIGKGYLNVTTPEGKVVKVPAISGFNYRMAIVRRIKAGKPWKGFTYTPEKIYRLVRYEIRDNIREYGDLDKAIKYALEDLGGFIKTFDVRISPALKIEDLVQEIHRFYPRFPIEKIKQYAEPLKRLKLGRLI